MADVVIENPVINAPYVEPKRHFVFGRDGITGEIADSRRRSSYFVPIAAPRRQAAQLTLEAEWTLDRIKENDSINRIRDEVAAWRSGGYQGVTTTTRRLLEHSSPIANVVSSSARSKPPRPRSSLARLPRAAG
jgi:type III restriction enzyme